MTQSTMDPWLVLRTRSQHEKTVEMSLQEKQIRAYLPKYRVVRRVSDRPAVVEVPLFPGYVFVQPRMDQYEGMRYIRGSCGFVVMGSKPATMPERDLEAVQTLLGSGVTLAVNAQLVPGRRVEVISGPFKGVRGEMVRVKCQDRLVINAALVGSSVSVEVDCDSVRVL